MKYAIVWPGEKEEFENRTFRSLSDVVEVTANGEMATIACRDS
jgi:hypothetical protein